MSFLEEYAQDGFSSIPLNLPTGVFNPDSISALNASDGEVLVASDGVVTFSTVIGVDGIDVSDFSLIGHEHAAGDVVSGSFADSRISVSSVTQHNSSLDHGLLDGLSDDDHSQYHNDARALTWLGTRSTTDLSEGSNLYYTNARADARIAAAVLEDLSDVVAYSSLTDDEVLQYNTAAGGWRHRTLSEAGISAVGHEHTADDVTSGSFDDARISESSVTQHNAALDHGLLSGRGDDDHSQYHNDSRALTWLGTRSTTDLSEGTNLYYTNARADARIAAAVLENISDVVAYSSLSDDEILVYNSAAGGWRHRTFGEAGVSATGHSHSTSDITSGTFDNARIAESNVTQHQAALTVLESQITDGSILARVGSNETITGAWTFEDDVVIHADLTLGSYSESGVHELAIISSDGQDHAIRMGEASDNYGWRIVYEGSSSNDLYFIRHDNDATGENVLSLDRSSGAAWFRGDVILSKNQAVYAASDDGYLIFSGGDGSGSGGNIVLYGSTHASRAGDIRFRSDTTDILEWDESASQWEFSSDVIISGSVGIGTSSPENTLSVDGDGVWIDNPSDIGKTQINVLENLSASDYIRSSIIMSRNADLSFDGTYWQKAGGSSNDWSAIFHRHTGVSILAGPSGSVSDMTNADFRSTYERLTILTDGKVGIGRTTPGSTLEVGGTVLITGDTEFGGDITVPDAGVISSESTDGSIYISGGTGSGNGANLLLCGPDLTSNEYDIFFRKNASTLMKWDDSESQWEFYGDITVGSYGIVVGSPTGGNKGSGTINAEAVYDDNSLLSDFVFERHWGLSPLDRPGYEIMSITDLEQFTRENFRLPMMPSRDDWEQERSLGKITNGLWEATELHTTYLFNHEQRIEELEKENEKLKLEIEMFRREVNENLN